jgi:23S rRNA pseudouridine1911/1915/1917 synthase
MEPRIIFEDEWLTVIDKPAGIVVNKSETTKGDTIQEWFGQKYIKSQGTGEFWEKGGVVHRLDKDTSGVMILAKNEKAYEFLKKQFLERTTLKKYTTLVHGTFRDPKGEVVKPLERHPKDRQKFTVGGDPARTAITEWEVMQNYKKEKDKFALLELTPHTGRTHQLRVHMQYLHHPIVGDPIYGFAKTWREDLLWCPRLFLHAKFLQITHPETGEKQIYESELLAELKTALNRLSKEG